MSNGAALNLITSFANPRLLSGCRLFITLKRLRGSAAANYGRTFESERFDSAAGRLPPVRRVFSRLYPLYFAGLILSVSFAPEAARSFTDQ